MRIFVLGPHSRGDYRFHLGHFHQRPVTETISGCSAEQLAQAHGYAYGGSIIQDMGYYPFGSKLFTDLTHYVRSGDFVLNLIRESQDLNEYAFALGALAHAAADNTGHRMATNLAVPLLYPKLRTQFRESRDVFRRCAFAR